MGNLPQYYITAYSIAVKHGFQGTEEEWLDSLGREGPAGKSAYQTAVEAGYSKSEEEFARHLADEGKSAYETAVDGGYVGTEEDFARKLAEKNFTSINGEGPGPDGGIEITPEKIKALPLSGGTMTGPLKVQPAADPEDPLQKQQAEEKFLQKTGGAVTGPLTVQDPQAPNQAANQGYVDKRAKEAVNGAWKTLTVKLPAGSWSGSQQTVSAAGVTENNLVRYDAAPGDANVRAFDEAGVYAYSQGNGTITFRYYEAMPSITISVSLAVRVGVQ